MSVRSASISHRKWPIQNRCREKLEELLSLADIRVGGNRPFDLQVHNEKFYARVLAASSMGLGESYMDGWWDCDRLDTFVERMIQADLHEVVRSWKDFLAVVRARVINLQSPSHAYRIGKQHYDIGNDLYRAMLDKRMIYSCGYWKAAATLDDAQEAKLDLVCKKLGLEPGMRVLDIGCGWGGAAQFAAQRYGVSVYGITVSKEQAKIARELCAGLPVEIELCDYRKINGTFDRAYSLGMFEHVGYKNYRCYMEVVSRCLTDEGLFLLHTIGTNLSDTNGGPWVERYIFPNSMLPSAKQITAAIERRFVLEDWQNFGPDYDLTLIHWFENFDRHWSKLQREYGQRFYRMWRYYLLSSAGAFRARHNQLWQIVLSPKGTDRRYDAPR